MKSHTYLKFASILASSSLLAVMLGTGCTKKTDRAFQLESSPVRFEYTVFNEPETLTELDGRKITRSQILDKSIVLKDLERQENDALIGLAYRLMAEKLGDKRGTIEIALPKSDSKLEQILSVFGWTPVPGLNIVYGKENPADKIIARLDQVSVSKDEIPTDHAVLYSIALRRYRETAAQLSSQIARIALHEKAEAAKKSIQDYINEEVLKGKPVEVSDSELKAYLAKIGFAESELTPALREQFITGMKEREQQHRIEEYVVRHILKSPLKVSFRPPVFPMRLPEDWKPVIGVKEAPVSIVAISSSTCPDCEAFVKMIHSLAEKFSGDVQIYWLNDFEESDGIARMVAEGATCAEQQRRGKSISFLQEFMPKAMQSDETAFYAWSEKNGLNRAQFESCFKGRESTKSLEKQRSFPRRHGIVARPSLWVGGELIDNTTRQDQVEELVEDLVENSGSNWFGTKYRQIKGWLDTKP